MTHQYLPFTTQITGLNFVTLTSSIIKELNCFLEHPTIPYQQWKHSTYRTNDKMKNVHQIYSKLRIWNFFEFLGVWTDANFRFYHPTNQRRIQWVSATCYSSVGEMLISYHMFSIKNSPFDLRTWRNLILKDMISYPPNTDLMPGHLQSSPHIPVVKAVGKMFWIFTMSAVFDPPPLNKF